MLATEKSCHSKKSAIVSHSLFCRLTMRRARCLVPKELLIYPFIRFSDTDNKFFAGCPSELRFNKPIVGIATTNAHWSRNMSDRQSFFRYSNYHVCQLINRHHFFRAYVERTGKGRTHEADDSL